MGRELARKWANLHELGWPNSYPQDIMADLHNNRVGRLLGEHVNEIRWAYRSVFSAAGRLCSDAYDAHLLWDREGKRVSWSSGGPPVANPNYDWGY